MNDLIPINELDLKSIPDLCDKNFFIPNYQRGYRWGKVQVEQLLGDLYTFIYDKTYSGDFYCLQSVVVREMSPEEIQANNLNSEFDNNRWYEVIDGQQRLTTIRIILALESSLSLFFNKQFTIKYHTRPHLGDIYNKIGIRPLATGKVELVTNGIDSIMDIDTWHVIQSARTILDWFQGGRNNDDKNEITEFAGRFSETISATKDKDKSVQVIWYELKDNSDPYEVFKRLNDKKVSLNNAELIRAMFLSQSAIYNTDAALLSQFNVDVRPIVTRKEQERKQSHIIEKWDIIENQLRDSRFWAFITSKEDSTRYSCHIEYLFDLISKKEQSEKDNLYTFLEFEKLLKTDLNNDLWDLWLKIEDAYSRLKAWFLDSDSYHNIGYLVTINGAKVLVDLLEKSQTLTKKAFSNHIESKIKETITDRKDKDGTRNIMDYSYDNDYELLKRVMFLYNVESSRILAQEPFPFDKYKAIDNWTLEHIHAQNSEKIDRSDKDKWNVWFKENIETIKRLHNQNPKDVDITTLLNVIESEYERFKNNTARYNFNNFNAIFDKVVNYFDKLCGENNKAKPMHNVTNMALLDGRTNTSISNSVFEVKRQIILQKDAEGSYIPLCTRNVFLKYYNRNDTSFIGNQSFYWSESDRQNYSADIQNVLKSYLIPGAKKKKDEDRDENKDENQETEEIKTIEGTSNE